MIAVKILNIKGAKVHAAVGPAASMVPGYAVRLRDVHAAAAEREVSATAILAEAFKGVNTAGPDHLVGPIHDMWLFRRTP